MVTLGDLVMILDLYRQGLSLSAIARRTGMDRRTVTKHVKCDLEPPHYGPRHPRSTVITPVEAYLRERIAAFPDLNGSRPLREIQERCEGRRESGTQEPPGGSGTSAVAIHSLSTSGAAPWRDAGVPSRTTPASRSSAASR